MAPSWALAGWGWTQVLAPGLLGRFLWHRPGLCQCWSIKGLYMCYIGPISPNFLRLVPA
jgi:hypothetical protein